MKTVEGDSWRAVLRRRIVGASLYSWRGLQAAFRHEEAFRLEVVLAFLLFPVGIWIADSLVEWLLLMMATALVLIVELLNSAIESAVDRIGDERHELAGRAKDIGSAAVMLSMGLFLIVWFGLAIW